MADILDYYHPEALSTAFYDLVSAHDPNLQGEIAFYERLVPEGVWVLELGCGTGRVGLALAANNRAVIGLDLSPAMLARGERKRQGLAPEVIQRTGFVHGDMTRFALGHEFDAVIAPFFGVSHLPLGEARRGAFKAMGRHLAPGGVAIVHTILPALAVAPGPVDPQRPVLDVAYDAAGSRLQVYVASLSFDAAQGRLEQLLDYVVLARDGTEARRSRERLTYFVSDLAADADGSGLVLEEKVSPFNAVGEMWVFRRKA